MKLSISISIAIAFIFYSFNSWSQASVDTNSQLKNILIEEYTGVRCNNCPRGHLLADSLEEEYGDRFFVVEHHPASSSYTVPYSNNDVDLRQTHSDSIFYHPLAGRMAMPGGNVNRYRRTNYFNMPNGPYGYYLWLPDQYHFNHPLTWRTTIDIIKDETSPLNIGIQTTYDASSQGLDINVGVYYTNDISNANSDYLSVYIYEDGLIAEQGGNSTNPGGTNYVHDHVLRATVTQTWGKDIGANHEKGDLLYSDFNINLDGIVNNLDNVYVLAFVSNGISDSTHMTSDNEIGETYTCQKAKLGFSSSITKKGQINGPSVRINYDSHIGALNIFLNNPDAREYTYRIYNTNLQLVKSWKSFHSKGKSSIKKQLHQLSEGIYFLQLNDNISTYSTSFYIKK